jgi:uncharacterized protein YraI
MRRSLMIACLASALALFSALAQAQHYAYATRNVNVRAGPDRSYPLVGWLQEGTEVEIFGCLEDWRWCEVLAGIYRGWVYSGFLAYPYQGGWATIRDVGPDAGLPMLSFQLDLYWNNHYTNWPWYPQWTWWASRPPPHRPPWRPPPRPPVVHPRPPIGIVPPLSVPLFPPIGSTAPAHPPAPAPAPPPGRPPGASPPVERPPEGRPPRQYRPSPEAPPAARTPATTPPAGGPPISRPPSAAPGTSGPSMPSRAPSPGPAPRPQPRSGPGG